MNKIISNCFTSVKAMNKVSINMLLKYVMKLRHLLFGRKAMTNLDSLLKSRHYFVNKGPSSQNYGFSSSHV